VCDSHQQVNVQTPFQQESFQNTYIRCGNVAPKNATQMYVWGDYFGGRRRDLSPVAVN